MLKCVPINFITVVKNSMDSALHGTEVTAQVSDLEKIGLFQPFEPSGNCMYHLL